jgi:hypothetical protein
MTTIAVLGSSDKLIQGKIEQSYFIEKYQKKTQCSTQILPLVPDVQINFGEEATIELLQQGDILRQIYLQFNYPTGQPSAVCDSFGTYMFNWVQLEYDSQVIERLDGEFIEITNDLSIPQAKQGTLSNLTGKYMTSNLATYYINLPFSILQTGLTVCALKQNPVLRFNLRNFSEGCPSASGNPLFDATLMCKYIFLEETERNYFIHKPLTYLYESVQRLDVDAGYANSISVYSDFQNSTKEIYIIIRNKNANAYVWNNTFLGGDHLSSMRLCLNATEFIPYDIGTPLFLRGLQGLDSHTRCPDRYFYMYNFSLDAESMSPSGSLNMSYVRQKFDINMTNSPSARLITLYSRCYNILNFQNGKLIVRYPVPFETSGYIANDIKQPNTLNNPGSITLFSNITYYTATSATYVFSFVNSINIITQWNYPYIQGLSWTPSNTGLSVVAASGASVPAQSVSITAGYGTGINFQLTVDNSSLFVLENPGPLTLYTVVVGSWSSRTLKLTNPYNLTPTWSYPALSGISWTTTTTGITLTAALASTLTAPSVTVTASYGTVSYSQTFYLRVDNTPGFIFI